MSAYIKVSVLPFASPAHAILLIFCLLLGMGLLALAWRRPRRRQRGPRALATAVAVAALWLVAFPPRRAAPVRAGEALLLTPGYHPDTLRQLRRELGATAPVWAYGDSALLATAGRAGARALPSLLTLVEQQPALRRLHVLGQGLPEAELPLLAAVPLLAHAGAAVAGFQAAFWPGQLRLGQQLQVEGRVRAPRGTPAGWVSLRAGGGPRDSVRVPAGGGPFRLRFQPKTTGLALYELRWRRPRQPLITEPVPVEIIPPALPAMLLLTATPAPEFTFLKNYLAEAHYPVALRTTLSRGLVQTEFVNQPSRPLSRLTPALLAAYQVLVADAATLARLSAAEAQTLQLTLRAGKLGLLVLADAAAPLPRALPARADFIVRARPAAAAAAPLPLTWPGAPAGLRAALPAQLRPGPAVRALVSGPGQLLLAARRRVGLGFVVVSVVPTTFQWALQGRAPAYAAYWTRLLDAAGPPAAPAATWRVAGRWPRPHEPLTLLLAGALPPAQSGPQPSVALAAGGPVVRLALRQDTRLPEWSSAQFWPAAAGWHRGAGPDRAGQHFYVYPAAAWPGAAQQQYQQARRQRPAAVAAAGRAADATSWESWPAAWFYGLFLLAAGYLWLEEKL